MKHTNQYLVDFNGARMLMIGAHKPLLCGQCHPSVFNGTTGIGHDPKQCVFEAFGINYTIIQKLDRRTNLYKHLECTLPQFHADMLRDISVKF